MNADKLRYKGFETKGERLRAKGGSIDAQFLSSICLICADLRLNNYKTGSYA